MKFFQRIDRYIIKNYLGTFLFALLLIISISVVFDINEKIDKLLNPELSLKEIVFDYYLNFIPYYANMLTPLFAFISVIFFTSKLADKSEIIAMMAAGVGFKRLILPYLFSALVIASGSFILSSFVIPPANEKRIEFQNKYIKNKKVSYAENVQLQVEPGVFAYFSRFDASSNMGYRFSLDYFEDKKLVSRLTAYSIKYDSLNHWSVMDYEIRDFDGMKEHISKGYRKDTVLNFVPSDFLISINDAETMTTPELATYINRQKERGIGNIKSFQIEYHNRYASVLASFILTIIGASLSSKKIKGGMGLNIGLGIALSFSYILFMTVSSTFAINGSMSPFLAAWFPNFIFIIVAFIVYKKSPR